MFSAVILVNNTGRDVSRFDRELVAAVRNGGTLPAYLADVFTLTLVTVRDGVRGILECR